MDGSWANAVKLERTSESPRLIARVCTGRFDFRDTGTSAPLTISAYEMFPDTSEEYRLPGFVM